MTKRILTSDLLVTDIIIKLEDDHDGQLKALIGKYDLKPGGKFSITKEQCEEFERAVDGKPYNVAAGGSSANVLTTLKKMLGDRIQVNFLGVVGRGRHRNEIIQSLKNSGINLIPPEDQLRQDIPHEGATSFVIVGEHGERTIATYQGNARDLLKPELITNELIDNNDVLFAPGSLWERMDPAYADKLLSMRWDHNKELWLSMPTTAEFGKNNAERFQYLKETANIILSNDQEMMTNTNAPSILEALKSQQAALGHHTIERENGCQQKNIPRHQQAFVTLGKAGAALVTDKRIEKFGIADNNLPIKNTLGAGDAAFAGFLAGNILNMPQNEMVRLGMTMAALKLREDGPRLNDPLGALEHHYPALANNMANRQDRAGDYNDAGYYNGRALL